MALISETYAREVLDSRGNPTVEVEVVLDDGTCARAIVPSGASTGTAEAVELRDNDAGRYSGRGVRKAVAAVNNEIAVALCGMDARNQQAVDERLIVLDGTANKGRLGANAILGASLAVLRAATQSSGVPLYQYLGGMIGTELPVPMVNILSGGLHGGGNIDFQDYMVIPLRATSFAEAMEQVVAVYRGMKEVLMSEGIYRAGVADEGGYAPSLSSNEEGFRLMVEAFRRAGFEPGVDMAIAVDVAASHFWNGRTYALAAEGVELKSTDLADRLAHWVDHFPILSIEDGVGEDDWNGWELLTKRLGTRCQLIGDDLFVTNASRLKEGVRTGCANAILVKMNQIGTISETLDVVRLAKQNGYRTIVSARSGETEDDSMADLAVGLCASQIKIGAITRSERLAKYNRLLRIEEDLGHSAKYRGKDVFAEFVSGLTKPCVPS